MARVANHGAGKAAGKAKPQQKCCILQYKQHDICSLRAQRHANADFTGAAAGGISHEAVEANQREE